MKKTVVLMLMLSPLYANALTVDNMLKLSDENGNGHFIINNNSVDKMYINANIKKVASVTKDKVIYESYTKENIADWQLSLSSNKFVLNPHESKSIGLRSLCKGSCASDKDQYYAVAFMPSYYDTSDEANKKRPAVGFVYGYEPLYVMPAKESEMDYEIFYNDKEVKIYNKGNTLLKTIINQCESPQDTDCKKAFTVISGREMTYKLPEKLSSKPYLNMDVLNYNGEYFKSLEVKKSKKIEKSNKTS